MTVRYNKLERTFKSPLGMFGAIYAGVVYTFGVVSIIGFQDDDHFAFISVLVIVFCLSLYYFLYARKRQVFSSDEEKIMFKVHVINSNIKTNQRRRGKKTWVQKIFGCYLTQESSDNFDNRETMRARAASMIYVSETSSNSAVSDGIPDSIDVVSPMQSLDNSAAIHGEEAIGDH